MLHYGIVCYTYGVLFPGHIRPLRHRTAKDLQVIPNVKSSLVRSAVAHDQRAQESPSGVNLNGPGKTPTGRVKHYWPLLPAHPPTPPSPGGGGAGVGVGREGEAVVVAGGAG